MQPQAGGSLDPVLVLGRDELVESMRSRLAAKVPLLITDPRRMGKTCLLDRLVFLTDDPWTAAKINYEGVTSVDGFLRRTMESLRHHQGFGHRALDAMRAFVENVEIEAGPLKLATTFNARPRYELFETIVGRVDDQLHGDECLILAFDEVPLAIENIVKHESPAAADALLQALRRLRQRSDSRIRWIVTGSVGFHHVLRLAGTTEGAINDFENVLCGPLDDGWARELAAALLRGIEVDFDEEAVEALVETSGGIAYLVHHLAHTLRGLNAPCTSMSVRDAWEAFLHDRDHSRAVTHFLTRIPDYYRDDTVLANRLLDMTALEPQALSFTDLLAFAFSTPTEADIETGRRVVDLLVDDHYLRDGAAGLEWRYPVLREIWAVRRRLRGR
jgi:hypothetical protein